MCLEIPRLTHAQRLQCLINRRELIEEIIEELGPDHKIEYTLDWTKITFKDRAEVLLNTEKILLKLAYQTNNKDLLVFGISFNKGQAVWEQIPIIYNYY
jgi:hypothetical protein